MWWKQVTLEKDEDSTLGIKKPLKKPISMYKVMIFI